MADEKKSLVNKSSLSYEEMRQLARHDDISVRCLLAERQDLKPEILYFLAEDPAIEVRQRIAQNPSTPRQADVLLAQDRIESVRIPLTEKIAQLAPEASPDERDKIRALTHEALTLLSRDQALKVRQILSDTLKDMVDAPQDIINILARDMELVVAGPVLQFSPVLSDEDLLDIISSQHAQGALNAISKRQNVGQTVTEAVIATHDTTAIADLLANDSAQIREDTLDMLAERAVNFPSWHAPLVRRPKLSVKAAQRMAHYLAENMLNALQARQDLPPTVIDMVKIEVKKRIDNDANQATSVPEQMEEEKDPMDEAQELLDQGLLDEDKIIDWMDDSQWLYVQSALAVLAGLRRVTVKKIIAAQSSKGIMALAWKAGISASLGESLQFKLAKIPISNILKATAENDYPLSEDELSWHLELFGD